MSPDIGGRKRLVITNQTSKLVLMGEGFGDIGGGRIVKVAGGALCPRGAQCTLVTPLATT